MKKFSLLLISIAIAITAFVAGLGFYFLPEKALHLKLPKETKLYLKSNYYTVWYYPEWFGQAKEFPGASFQLKRDFYLKSKPSIVLKSSQGKTIGLSRLPEAQRFRSVDFGHMIVIPLGQLLVPEKGHYKLIGNSEDGKSFVIALVPPNAEAVNQLLPGPPPLPFSGVSDFTLDNEF